MILHPIPYKEGILWIDKETKLIVGDYYIYNFTHLYQYQNEEPLLGITAYKVVAQSPNLSLPDIPYIEIEENIDILTAGSLLQKGYDLNDPFNVSAAGGYCSGFKDGYKAGSAKKYTEEDLRKAFQAGTVVGIDSVSDESDPYKRVVYWHQKEDVYIQSLQPKPVSVEIDMYNGNTGDFYEYWKDGKAFLKVKKVNYES